MKNSLLSPRQTGFRKFFGIYDPLIELTSYVHHGFNNGSSVLYIYVDLAKAFNSLDNRILLYKLERLGFKENILEVLANYVIGRKQIILFDDTTSSSGTISHRVAQGSVLGPLLFSVYMNDLPCIFRVLNIGM